MKLPVVMIGDIDRGGVIASLVGTHAVLEPDDRRCIKGFVINKFRGASTLFDDGRRFITEKTGWQDFGMLPFLPEAGRLPAEDAVVLETAQPETAGRVSIVVPMLSRISNFDDFDPLKAEPNVDLKFVPPGQPLPVCDMVILPGSKSTVRDLGFLRAQGWDIDIHAHVRRGGQVLGICGGYQMLGTQVCDPDGREGPPGKAPGLGLLPVETIMDGPKTLRTVEGRHLESGLEVSGYEMHIGRTALSQRGGIRQGLRSLISRPREEMDPADWLKPTVMTG